MTAYRLTRQADRNLIDIYLYSAERFGIRQADSYANSLQKTFRSSGRQSPHGPHRR